jgi:hypothetical protein
VWNVLSQWSEEFCHEPELKPESPRTERKVEEFWNSRESEDLYRSASSASPPFCVDVSLSLSLFALMHCMLLSFILHPTLCVPVTYTPFVPVTVPVSVSVGVTRQVVTVAFDCFVPLSCPVL